MVEKGDIVHIDPRHFVGRVAPLPFLNLFCEGCSFAYAEHSDYDKKVAECLYCMENKVEPAYKKKTPFILERETHKITYLK